MRIDIPDEYLLRSWMSLDDAIMSEKPDEQQPTRPCIQRVPSTLRDKDELKRYYEPMVVAFGPIHSNKPPYGEKVKLKLAAHFIQQNDIPRETALLKILDDLPSLMGCYKGHYDNDHRLPFMFLVDGCALLQLMVCSVHDENMLLHHVNYNFISFAKRDILLLENQLPYRLLQLLASFIHKYVAKEGLIHKLTASEYVYYYSTDFFLTVSPIQLRVATLRNEYQPCHLLDLLHQILTFDPPRQMDLTGRWRRTFMTCFKRTVHWKVKRCERYTQATFRSARELKSVGIGSNQSRTGSVKDVTFQQKLLRGTLSLPCIEVNDSTISMFMNLAAYEMLPDFKSKFEVSSYICFLSALIDHGDDVWLLRQARILKSNLGSDEDVAKLFKQLAIHLVPNPDIYRTTKGEMYKHHKNTGIIRTWSVEMNEKYFSKPWTLLAVCGAVFGLFLGFIQTLIAVKSYYHPQKP